MTSRELAIAMILMVCAGAGAGCVNDLDWQPVASGRGLGVGRFAWRNDHELWVSVGTDVLRRTDGAWEQLDVCGDAVSNATSVAFDGEDVWALCGDSASQQLIHYDGAMHGEVVSPPFDGQLGLVPMIDGVAVVGETRIHRRVDGAWVEIATTPGSLARGSCAGRSDTEIYCSLDDGSGVQRWDGASWTPTGITAYVAPEVRAGEIWLGAGRFVDGEYESYAGTTERPLVAVTVVPPSTVIWGGGDTEGLYLWRGPRGGGPSEFVGGAPGVAAVGPGGTSGGSNSVYAIDASTFLMISTNTTLSGSFTNVLEGRL